MIAGQPFGSTMNAHLSTHSCSDIIPAADEKYCSHYWNARVVPPNRGSKQVSLIFINFRRINGMTGTTYGFVPGHPIDAAKIDDYRFWRPGMALSETKLRDSEGPAGVP